MKKNARKKLKLRAQRLSTAYRHQVESHPDLVDKLMEIHRRANLIRLRAYEVVDTAQDAEERSIMETEACIAMAMKAGETKLRYRPGCWDKAIDDWTKGC